ncbi:uncharacterized protein PFL1_00643 [Pseudozyma flocculosa PF-1]|uniref:DUF6534 domain-containing protein n=1 Tax=Pseudozyma flocculosa TaxID=84751 RepID=A0A5C3EST4_9BASI|nr:uncharacterized protein PFL1_00643 [Pseudozyma flocculosa PF-1]EPQ32447.1 hypothetical protein PFL1_00643 [Pseudozyma flocculosa PF-1]SPO34566.1 uncharacterized protein PSFLO_00037 [Pseudozyma flocculosa]
MAAGTFDLTLGCLFIGVSLNVWLFGFSLVQAYIYYVHFPNDKRFMRWFVFFLVLADALNACFDLAFLYQYLVSYFGDLNYASYANTAFTADPVMTGIIAFATQLFFAWRVYKLMHNVYMPTIIAVGALISFLGGVGTTIAVAMYPKFADFQKFQVIVIIWLVGAAVTDVIITLSLVWTLNKARTGFAATDDIITKLIRTTLQTGMLTTFFATVDIILFLASSTSLHLVFNLPLAKLYVNTLLSTLNARVKMTPANAHYTLEGSHSDRATGAERTKRSGVFNKGATSRPAAFKSHISSNNDIEENMRDFAAQGNDAGIHIRTVEETFEERHELEQTRPYIHSTHSESFRTVEKPRISEQDSM